MCAVSAYILSSYCCLCLTAARQYWCFRYEAKNKETKSAAQASNYKDVLSSTATRLSYQAARKIRKRNYKRRRT